MKKISYKSKILTLFVPFFIFTNINPISYGNENKGKIILLKKDKENVFLKDMMGNVESILEGVQKTRQLSVNNPVSVGIKTKDELKKFLATLIQEEYPDKDIMKDYLLYERLGLLKRGTNLKETFLKLYSEQVAGFYDDRSQALYMIDNPNFSGDMAFSIVISHELIHAIQDQNFNIRKLLTPEKNSDVILARSALIEGEATVASLEYLMGSFGMSSENMPDISAMMNNPLLAESIPGTENMPGFLLEQIKFPYSEGSKFVQYVYGDSKDWNDFNNVYKRPPNSTEQIMHPEKYIKNEQPVKIETNEKLMTDKNWKYLQKDSFGEFFLLNYFLEYMDEELAKKASEGWGGDKFMLFSNNVNDSLIVYKSVWDTKKDAQEFFDAYIKTIQNRYSQKDLKISQNSKTKFYANTPCGKVLIILNENSVNLADGYTDLIEKNINNMLM